MPECWFFLSYARLDRDEYLKKFYKELDNTVRRLGGLTEESIGFFDSKDIEPGDEWPEKLAEELRTSRVFVCLYSPTYFTREYCGKEWQVFRSRLDAYAATSGVPRPPLIMPVLWVPLDTLPKKLPVAILAQDVASREKLRYEVIPLDAKLIERLEEADRDNKIVAIIVDTWMLRLHQYHTFMREYDKHHFLNCVVLVPWNARDDETISSRSVLERAVHVTFLNRVASKDPNYFLDRISSSEEFMKELGAALTKTRMRIVEKAEVIKKAESEHVIVKPAIAGPGGISV